VITALLIETVSVSQRGVALGFALVLSTGAGGLIATEILGILSDRYGLARAMFVVPAAAALAAIAWTALAIRQSRSSSAQPALAPA
jgi:fucose permease